MPARPAVPALHVELLHDDDALHGPARAVVDLLATMRTIAAVRRERARIGWQWTATDGGPAPRALRGEGRRVARPDVVLLPGWHARSGPRLDTLVRRHAAGAARLRALHAGGTAVLAVFTGSALLARAGLLDGREAAVPWAFAQATARQGPGLRIAADAPFVGADGIWSCGSPADAMAAMQALLHEHGPFAALADAAAAVLLPSPQRRALAARHASATGARVAPGAVERARRHLEANVDRPYDLESLARTAATSPRSLLRHFRAAHGTTPLRYLQRLRATRARMLLESTYLGIDAIAEACGYRDTVMFRRVFERETGWLPGAYRERHRLRARRRDWGADLA